MGGSLQRARPDGTGAWGVLGSRLTGGEVAQPLPSICSTAIVTFSIQVSHLPLQMCLGLSVGDCEVEDL
jgi:hypothetical protein